MDVLFMCLLTFTNHLQMYFFNYLFPIITTGTENSKDEMEKMPDKWKAEAFGLLIP